MIAGMDPGFVDLVQWAFGGFMFAVGWLVRAAGSALRAYQHRRRLLARMDGLPTEAKTLLGELYDKGPKTLSGFVDAPEVKLLVAEGILRAVPTSRWIDGDIEGYLSISPDFVEVVKHWVKRFPPQVGPEV